MNTYIGVMKKSSSSIPALTRSEQSSSGIKVHRKIDHVVELEDKEMYGDIDAIVMKKLGKLVNTCRADCLITKILSVPYRSDCVILKTSNKFSGVVSVMVEVEGVIYNIKEVVFDAKRIADTNEYVYNDHIIIKIGLDHVDIADKSKIIIQMDNISYSFSGRIVSDDAKIYTVPNFITVYKVAKSTDKSWEPIEELKALITEQLAKVPDREIQKMICPYKEMKKLDYSFIDILKLENKDQDLIYHPADSFYHGRLLVKKSNDITDISARRKVAPARIGDAVQIFEGLLTDYYRYLRVVNFLSEHKDYVLNMSRFYQKAKV